MRGAYRGLLLLAGVYAAMLGSGAAMATARTTTAAARATTATARTTKTAAGYYVTFKVAGSFKHTVLGMALAGFNQTDVATWSYRERFGPVDLAHSTRHVRTSAPKVSGSWSTSLMYTADNAQSDCSQLGHFNSGAAQMSVVAADVAGSKGAALVLSAGQQGLSESPLQNCDDAQEFFGGPDNVAGSCNAGSGSIREALQQSGPGCSTATFFTVHLGVSERALSAHHFSYNISSAKSYAEKVSPGCNQQDNPSMGYLISCTYGWSGTVTLRPAG